MQSSFRSISILVSGGSFCVGHLGLVGKVELELALLLVLTVALGSKWSLSRLASSGSGRRHEGTDPASAC
jgi:hypothetical protein